MSGRLCGRWAVLASVALAGCVTKGTHLALFEKHVKLGSQCEATEKRRLKADLLRKSCEEQVLEGARQARSLEKRVAEEVAAQVPLRLQIKRLDGELSRRLDHINDLKVEVAMARQQVVSQARDAKREKEVLRKDSDKEAHRFDAVIRALRQRLDGDGVEILPIARAVAIRIFADALFKKANRVKRDGAELLDRVATVLGRAPGTLIQVQGHSDSTAPPRRWRFKSNWELSFARALAVVRALEAGGIEPARLSAAAFGEHRPIASNDARAGRARNRRVEIILLPDDSRVDRPVDPERLEPDRADP